MADLSSNSPPEDGEIVFDTPKESAVDGVDEQTPKTANNRRHQRSTSSSSKPRSDDEGSSGNESDSSGSSSSSSEASANPKRQSRVKVVPPSSKHKDDAEYTRFDTGSKARQKLVLTQGMEEYLSDKFTHYVKDKTIQDSVLDSNPLPEVNCLNTPKVDDYLGEIFESLNKSYGKESDGTLSKTQARISNVMGPLGRLWLNLEEVRTGKSPEELDLFECLRLVEQSVTLLGQANVSLTYARRLAVLGRLTGDAKKAKKLLSKHESCLTQSQRNLFGKKFYKALRTATKIRKSTKEISTHLSGSSRPRPASFKGSVSTRKETFRQDTRTAHQPFRGGPPSRGRGGGRSVSFRARGSSHKGYFKGKFVRFRIQKRSPESSTQSPDANQISGGTESGGSGQCPPCINGNGHGHHNSVQTPSVSREAPTLPEQLETTDSGSVYFGNDCGNSDSFYQFSTSESCSSSDISQSVRKSCHSPGDIGDAPERGNSGGLSYEWGIFKFSFPSQEERWGEQTCNQLERVEFLRNIPALQNGGSVFTETFDSDGGLDDKNRFERCLLFCASKQTTSTPLAFHARGCEIPILLSPLWIRARPSPFYEAFKACCCPIKETGPETNYLSRRHYCFQSDSGGYFEGQGLNPLAAPAFRFCDQLEEVSFTSSPVHGIPRFCHQLPRDEAFLANRENVPTSPGLQRPDLRGECLSANSLSHYWETDFNFTGSPPSSPPLPAFTNATGERLVGGEGLQLGCSSKQGMPERSPVVDRPTVDLEWEVNNLTSPRFDYYNGCVLEGLGGSVSGSSYQGALDPGGIVTAYKCPRTQGSSLCFESFLQQSKETSCPSPNGQQNSSCIPTKNGGDTVSGASRDSPGIMGIRSEEGNFPYGRILARGYESRSRLAVETLQRFEQLETESQSFSNIGPVMGPPNNRSLCGSHEFTTSELCELVPRPLCSGNRCLSDSLVEREGLLLSPIFTDLPLSGKDKEGPGNNGSDSTNLACTGMVPSPVGDVLQASHFTSPTEGSFTLSQPTATPSDSAGPPAISGLDGYRQNLLTGGVSEDTANLLRSHSWRKGTAGAYNSAWKQWSSWCGQRKVDPFCSTVASIADYLTELFKKGRSYHTVNIHRSAISAFHRPIDGVKVGQHDLVCRVLNACFNARPPQPRYVVTWDVDKVLSYIHSLRENSTLSDKCLTLKLSMLLALASAGRSSDLRALDIRYMTITDHSISFELGVLTKSRRKGQPPIKLTFDRFDSDPLVCVVSTISCYLDRSKAWRAGSDKTQLLLSYIRPHKEVVPCTIAGWLVELMKQSGIDTSEFRAHSTRGASTSKAKAKGLSCQEILAMANWKKESTFRRHYLREIASESAGSFQAVVLQ